MDKTMPVLVRNDKDFMSCRNGNTHEKKIENGPKFHYNAVASNMVSGDPKTKTDENASFLRAARGGNLEKVLECIKNNTDINTCNANGLNALHLASKEGHIAVVKELLTRGAKIDASTKKGNTALHIASLAGQDAVVKILIEHNATLNVQSQNGFSPLYMAAQENHDAVVRLLLASGASQTLATEDGFTPLAVALQQGHDKVVAVLLESDTRGRVHLPALHIAAKKDDTKAANLLLSNDHNPDVTSKSGFTPLHIAAHYGNENIAALLIQRAASVNYAAKHNITPLHVAAKWGKSNMVSLLLDNGANLQAKTRDGLTPLHCAARSGHEKVVNMMVRNGAPIAAKTKNGLAPLHMASQGDHVEAARILLQHNSPVDEVTVDYLTALHVAAHCGHGRVAKLLLDNHADANARALNGFTPLHIACKKNRVKVVELLLQAGASIEATTESGLTPLHVAAFMGCMNIVIYLIQNRASPDEATVRGETPLHLAARANQTDIIRILLRNGANVNARAREQQTPLHIASRLGNVDIVVLLLQSRAEPDAATQDLYTSLHIAAKEGQEEVAAVLLDHGSSMTAATKKGFTPLHLAAKYGNINVCQLLVKYKGVPIDSTGKNGVTPLHVAAHYNHKNVTRLLLENGASPHATAKNGYTPLHICAKKNQMENAQCLIKFGADPNAESKAGFTPLHLASQEGHLEMTKFLLKCGSKADCRAKNGLIPMHLCSQEDKVDVAGILMGYDNKCLDIETKAGYTPLHVAAHFGSLTMVRFLVDSGLVRINAINELGYTPLHQAAQQGHTQIIQVLLQNGASPNSVSNNGQTALSIAQRLGYISAVETLRSVTDSADSVSSQTTLTSTTLEDKYKVVVPESMQETFMSESEDEAGDEPMQVDTSYKYLTVDEMKSLGDDSVGQFDVTHDDDGRGKTNTMSLKSQRKTVVEKSLNKEGSKNIVSSLEEKLSQMERNRDGFQGISLDQSKLLSASDNMQAVSGHIQAVNVGFLVSFMVDARGGAMRGCRHSGVRIIIPPRKAPMPMRITCRYLKRDKMINPPPLMEGEAIASRVLELGPSSAKFLGPVIIEVPHFASLRGKEREIVILRSDHGETWREHTLEASEDAIQDVLQESFDKEDLDQLEDLNTNRITRILTTDFPQYFAIVSRIRQEIHAIGSEGGTVASTVVSQVQAVFPPGSLTKKIKVGLQAHPISTDLTSKLLGNRVAVSPIVTVEPRRRKFHKPITLIIPVPQAMGKGMLNQYGNGSDTTTLRLLCSITGGTTWAQWEDVTGSTPLVFLNDCVSFTTTVSARFWLIDCRHVSEATKMASDLYREAIHVPYMAKFCVFAKRHELLEARLRLFCMTDDKEERTLEGQEHYIEVAKSRDVELMDGTSQFVEFGGNLVPVTKSGEQLFLTFHAFKENRLGFNVKIKDQHSQPMGRVIFMTEPNTNRQDVIQSSICNLNIELPEEVVPDVLPANGTQDLIEIQNKYNFLRQSGYGNLANPIHKADLRLSDIAYQLHSDWLILAHELSISESDISLIRSEYPNNEYQQAIVMLRLWHGSLASSLHGFTDVSPGNIIESALRNIGRDDIVNKCIFNIEVVTDEAEKTLAQSALCEIHQDIEEPESIKMPALVKDDFEPSNIESKGILGSTMDTGIIEKNGYEYYVEEDHQKYSADVDSEEIEFQPSGIMAPRLDDSLMNGHNLNENVSELDESMDAVDDLHAFGGRDRIDIATTEQMSPRHSVEGSELEDIERYREEQQQHQVLSSVRNIVPKEDDHAVSIEVEERISAQIEVDTLQDESGIQYSVNDNINKSKEVVTELHTKIHMEAENLIDDQVKPDLLKDKVDDRHSANVELDLFQSQVKIQHRATDEVIIATDSATELSQIPTKVEDCIIAEKQPILPSEVDERTSNKIEIESFQDETEIQLSVTDDDIIAKQTATQLYAEIPVQIENRVNVKIEPDLLQNTFKPASDDANERIVENNAQTKPELLDIAEPKDDLKSYEGVAVDINPESSEEDSVQMDKQTNIEIENVLILGIGHDASHTEHVVSRTPPSTPLNEKSDLPMSESTSEFSSKIHIIRSSSSSSSASLEEEPESTNAETGDFEKPLTIDSPSQSVITSSVDSKLNKPSAIELSSSLNTDKIESSKIENKSSKYNDEESKDDVASCISSSSEEGGISKDIVESSKIDISSKCDEEVSKNEYNSSSDDNEISKDKIESSKLEKKSSLYKDEDSKDDVNPCSDSISEEEAISKDKIESTKIETKSFLYKDEDAKDDIDSFSNSISEEGVISKDTIDSSKHETSSSIPKVEASKDDVASCRDSLSEEDLISKDKIDSSKHETSSSMPKVVASKDDAASCTDSLSEVDVISKDKIDSSKLETSSSMLKVKASKDDAASCTDSLSEEDIISKDKIDSSKHETSSSIPQFEASKDDAASCTDSLSEEDVISKDKIDSSKLETSSSLPKIEGSKDDASSCADSSSEEDVISKDIVESSKVDKSSKYEEDSKIEYNISSDDENSKDKIESSKPETKSSLYKDEDSKDDVDSCSNSTSNGGGISKDKIESSKLETKSSLYKDEDSKDDVDSYSNSTSEDGGISKDIVESSKIDIISSKYDEEESKNEYISSSDDDERSRDIVKASKVDTMSSKYDDEESKNEFISSSDDERSKDMGLNNVESEAKHVYEVRPKSSSETDIHQPGSSYEDSDQQNAEQLLQYSSTSVTHSDNNVSIKSNSKIVFDRDDSTQEESPHDSNILQSLSSSSTSDSSSDDDVSSSKLQNKSAEILQQELRDVDQELLEEMVVIKSGSLEDANYHANISASMTSATTFDTIDEDDLLEESIHHEYIKNHNTFEPPAPDNEANKK